MNKITTPALKEKSKKKVVATVLAAALLIGLGAGITGVVSAADTATTPTTQSSTYSGSHAGHGVMGTVASVSGTTITVTGKNGTTYTVDASNATFLKTTPPVAGSTPTAPTTITIAGIAVGDTVRVQGTVSGTSVTATKVIDGIGGGRGGFGGKGHGGMGHGVTGTVSAVSGDTITITNSKGTSYTIDATNATASEVVSLPISSIKVGNTLGVQGTVSGTTVTATHIMDGIPTGPQAPSTSTQ